MDKNSKIVITGAAGLVGQNLVLLLREQGYHNIVAIDKNETNLGILNSLNPHSKIIHADLATSGPWQQAFKEANTCILLHAQITGLQEIDFIRNNITATEKVIETIKHYQIGQLIHISSSVVNSVANDLYSTSKRSQENIILNNFDSVCVLRPTLMFGWFDRKHLGWLSRFMQKSPIFPIPGKGQYIRQPLFSRDFCKIIIASMEQNKRGIYDIVGNEEITYIGIIKLIKELQKIKSLILPIPYSLFYTLLKIYSFFNKKPPFTTEQLKALTAGDYFKGVDIEKEFNISPTPLKLAFAETFTHPQYSEIELQRI